MRGLKPKPILKGLLLLSILLLFGCANDEAKPTADSDEQSSAQAIQYCPEVASVESAAIACAAVYAPVCALDDGVKLSYSNSCKACAAGVQSYTHGACD